MTYSCVLHSNFLLTRLEGFVFVFLRNFKRKNTELKSLYWQAGTVVFCIHVQFNFAWAKILLNTSPKPVFYFKAQKIILTEFVPARENIYLFSNNDSRWIRLHTIKKTILYSSFSLLFHEQNCEEKPCNNNCSNSISCTIKPLRVFEKPCLFVPLKNGSCWLFSLTNLLHYLPIIFFLQNWMNYK